MIALTEKNDSGAPCIGSIVQSVSGRDRKRYFVIVAREENDQSAMVYIADGLLHKIERPKKKNLRHLKIAAKGDIETACAIERGEMTNSSLRTLLREKSLLYVNDRRDCSAEG